MVSIEIHTNKTATMKADTIGELNNMADRLGVSRSKMQKTPYPNYLLTASEVGLAIMYNVNIVTPKRGK